MKDENNTFTLQADIDLDDEFDPLEDFESDEDDDSQEITGLMGKHEGALAPTDDVVDTRPAEERIAELLTQMAPRRKILLGIMDYCRDPQAVTDVNARVDELQENNFSVYSAADLCKLLEKAGALKRQTADGQPVADADSTEPEIVVIDGVEYLEPRAAKESFWVATDAAIAAVAADKPLERLSDLFDADEKYLIIHKRILTLCAKDGGASTDDLGNAVDKDPLVQSPRLYAPHFIDKLEKCDALEWKKTWRITDIGRAGLDMLANISDENDSENDKEVRS